VLQLHDVIPAGHGLFSHHHPGVRLSVNAKADLGFLHGHKKLSFFWVLAFGLSAAGGRRS
jgi:hypothetical protein